MKISLLMPSLLINNMILKHFQKCFLNIMMVKILKELLN